MCMNDRMGAKYLRILKQGARIHMRDTPTDVKLVLPV